MGDNFSWCAMGVGEVKPASGSNPCCSLPSYLLFTSSKFLGPQCKSRDLKMFRDLVHRCLATVPTRTTVPFSSTHYWSNYRFHNKVLNVSWSSAEDC